MQKKNGEKKSVTFTTKNSNIHYILVICKYCNNAWYILSLIYKQEFSRAYFTLHEQTDPRKIWKTAQFYS